MYIDLNDLVAISGANQNFSKVARMVDENGTAVILKNDTPRYILIDYSKLLDNAEADYEMLRMWQHACWKSTRTRLRNW